MEKLIANRTKPKRVVQSAIEVQQKWAQAMTPLGTFSGLHPIPEPMSRTALAAVEYRKTVASVKTAHLQSRYWDRFLGLSEVEPCIASVR